MRQYRGPKLVEFDRGEIRQAVKAFHKRLPEARSVILLIERKDGSRWVTSTCAETERTATLLEGARLAYVK